VFDSSTSDNQSEDVDEEEGIVEDLPTPKATKKHRVTGIPQIGQFKKQFAQEKKELEQSFTNAMKLSN